MSSLKKDVLKIKKAVKQLDELLGYYNEYENSSYLALRLHQIKKLKNSYKIILEDESHHSSVEVTVPIEIVRNYDSFVIAVHIYSQID